MKVISKVESKLKSKSVSFDKTVDPKSLEFDEFFDGETIKKYAHTLVNVKLPVENPFFISWINNSIICCSLSGDTYIKKDNTFIYVGKINVSKKPILSTIVIEGVRYPLLIDGDNNAYKIFNENALLLIGEIDADVVCNNGEMLFAAKGRTITFSAPNDMTDFTFSIDRAGQITVEDGYGDIISMATENKKLIIFTRKAVFEFNPVGARTDYTLRRIEFDALNVLDGSVKDIGDKIVFISNRKIYYYKGGKIYLEQSYIYDNDFAISGTPAVDNKIYYVAIRANKNNYLLRYDFDNKKFNLVSYLSNYLFDGIYPVISGDSLYKIELITARDTPVYAQGNAKLDLNKKIFVKVIAFVVGSGILLLKGDNSSVQISLNKGLNEKKIRLSSVNFSMEILEQSADFEILEMQVKYKIKGE